MIKNEATVYQYWENVVKGYKMTRSTINISFCFEQKWYWTKDVELNVNFCAKINAFLNVGQFVCELHVLS